jgi:heat shock protein HtpX
MALAASGLRTHIWNNQFYSVLLLCLYPLIMLGLLWCIGAALGVLTTPTPNGTQLQAIAVHAGNSFFFNYWPLMLTAIAIWFVISFFWNTKMMASLSHAKPVTRQEEPALYNLLENLCIAVGQKMPQLYVIESKALNAFASGINDKTYAVTVTRGLLETLDNEELEAVLGHELSHILHKDVRLLMICVVFTGLLGFTAQLFWSQIRYRLFWGNMGSSRRRGGDARIFLVMLVIGAILWVGYMATIFTRLAISRRREFMADAGAVTLTKRPEAMMRALMAISGHSALPADVSDDVRMMCTDNTKAFLGLFQTHPPISARLAALSQISGVSIESLTHSDTSRNSPHNPWLE